MRIYKTGYVSGAQVTRIYESPDGNKGKGQQRYNTFCFKAFSSEQQPSYKAKGFGERIFTVKCSPGNPQYDISEVINDVGDPIYKKLYREIEDLRKLLLIYRILHYDDQIPDIQLSIRNRDKQVCKPLLRLFGNTKALTEITNALNKFLTEKKDKNLNSLDSHLFSCIYDLLREENTAISNETLWHLVCCLPGNLDPKNPHSFQSDDFGKISKTRITKICENKFGAVRGHDGQKRSLIFNKNTIQKLENNYSPIKEIAILSTNVATNTFNTFNTFWDNVERNGDYKNKFSSNKVTKNRQNPNETDECSNDYSENNNNSLNSSFEDNEEDSSKVLEVLENKNQKEDDREMEDKNNNNIIKKTDSNSNNCLYVDNKKEQIEKFFASDIGQEKEHVLEESICTPLIGKQSYKPYFLYCKICPKVENINLKSIEDHIRLKDPQRHKAKLLELLQKEEE